MNKEPIRALLSVWHKELLIPLAEKIHECEGEVWASAGTAQALEEAGLPVRRIESLTGFTELLGGRVKTLHPTIFSGILARSPEELPPGHPIWNLVAVELYPFHREAENWIELIDIGGVSLLRAAAKNYARVWVIPGPSHYEQAIRDMAHFEGLPPVEIRYRYAADTFSYCATYDGVIAKGFVETPLSPVAHPLRYGENPHQKALFLGPLPETIGGKKPLSYNNLLDIEKGWHIVRDWHLPACVILKHTQPCGAAYAPSAHEAYKRALAADPIAAYGGIVVCNFPIEEEWVSATKGHFIEVLAAPSFSEGAVQWLQTHKTAVLVRLPASFSDNVWEVRTALGGFLWQEPHRKDETNEDPDIRWAARLLRSLYSNAVVVVADGQLVAAASGETSRIEAVRLAIERTQKRPFPPESVLVASDGFFPFTDSLALIHQAGIRRVAVPTGGKRQQEIEEFAQAHDICLTFFSYRHFRH
ncbi:MAG: hypothetical protein N2170_07795 [Bacteroidia bacterium]|nr:hypothetical protein [Bacteroidia bacterium]